MNRLTNKHSDGKYYPSINNIVQQKGYDGSNYREFIHIKLGKLEDLMEKYGIENVKELESIIKDHKTLYDKEIELSADLGMFQNENINLTKDIEKYWEIEQQLGCPLEVVFKALKDGIIYKKDDGKNILIPNLIFTHLLDEEIPDYHFINYDLENLENNLIVRLRDYQKTWWLKGEKE